MGDLPTIEVTGFQDKFESIYLKAYRLHFEQAGVAREYDLALRHSSVACLLYHTERKQFLVVRQFRPAIFVSRVAKLEENIGKKLSDIDWPKYDREIGCTRELCAGLIDKDIPLIHIAREEIEEECGYSVKEENIMHIASFIVDMDESGQPQHLFYAQIDESMKCGEGGGLADHGEFIYKIWMNEAEALSYLSSPDPSSPPAALYALLWWFDRKERGIAHTHKDEQIDWPPSSINWPVALSPRLENIRFTPNTSSNRYHPIRLLYNINGISRTWDIATRQDSASVLIYNRDRRQLIMNQRFRPAILIGRTRNLPENKGKDLMSLDYSTRPLEWMNSIELCSGHLLNRNETPIACAVRNVATKAGYRIDEKSLRPLTCAVMGVSQAGDKQNIYYVEVGDKDAIEGFNKFEDIEIIPLSRENAACLLRAKLTPSPPNVLFTIRWFLSNITQ